MKTSRHSPDTGKQKSFLDCLSVCIFRGIFMSMFSSSLECVGPPFQDNPYKYSYYFWDIVHFFIHCFLKYLSQNSVRDRMNITAQDYSCICNNKNPCMAQAMSIQPKFFSPLRTDWSPLKNVLKYSVVHNNLKAMCRDTMKEHSFPHSEAVMWASPTSKWNISFCVCAQARTLAFFSLLLHTSPKIKTWKLFCALIIDCNTLDVIKSVLCKIGQSPFVLHSIQN